jgi:hypothetical protein
VYIAARWSLEPEEKVAHCNKRNAGSVRSWLESQAARPFSIVTASRIRLRRARDQMHDTPPHHELHTLQLRDVIERTLRHRDDIRILASFDGADALVLAK